MFSLSDETRAKRAHIKPRVLDPISMTRQEFARDVNINMIMKKALQHGALPEGKKGYYADVSGVGDYSNVIDKIRAVDKEFMNLSSDIRRKFDNSPNKLASWLIDPKNLEESIKLGLRNPKESNEASASLPTGGVAPTA